SSRCSAPPPPPGRSRRARSAARRCGASVCSSGWALTIPKPRPATRHSCRDSGNGGWIVGRNLQIDYRWGGGNAPRYRRQAAELVALAPELSVAMGGSVVGPLLQTTRTVPLVFLQVTDPVSSGYVASLARPGGNATGFALFESGISAKWLELLKEI